MGMTRPDDIRICKKRLATACVQNSMRHDSTAAVPVYVVHNSGKGTAADIDSEADETRIGTGNHW